MLGKIKSKFNIVVSLVVFGIIFQVHSMAMETQEDLYGIFEADEEGITQEILDEFKGVKRYDPIFYKIVMHDDREIYVLGYTHSIPPQLFLSNRVYSFLKFLANRSILFTEHKSTAKYIREKLKLKLQEPQNQNINSWNPVEQFNLKGKQLEVWNLIKDQDISSQDPIKIYEITKLTLAEGSMLLGSIPSRRTTNLIPGIGSVLRSWTWHNPVQYLETPEEALQILESEIHDIRKFFIQALGKFRRQNSTQDETLIRYKKAIGEYSHQKYFDMQGSSKPSTQNRNVVWATRMKTYLHDHPNPQVPILIVCGSAHLAGGGNNQSFLHHFLDGMNIKSIHRMTHTGAWVDFHSQDLEWLKDDFGWDN